MMKKYISIIVVILTGLATLNLVSCSQGSAGEGRLMVAVTILPQAGFVEAVGGDKVDVVVMVPPGASPHTYEVTPDQMASLSKARIYAEVGSPVEFELAWMDKLIAVNKSMLVVDCSQGIPLLEMTAEENEGENITEEQHTGLDPHIWLSVKNVRIMASNICAGLVQVDTENKAYYENNLASYLDLLDKLDADLTADLANITNRNFIVVHPSFGYFAHDYNLNQMSLEQNGKEPDADYTVRLIEKAKELSIKVIFVSPQYGQKSAELIAREIGGEVAIIDPLAKDFIGNMHKIESAVKQSLQQKDE
jgi:zinc transport system substrate-binding protein